MLLLRTTVVGFLSLLPCPRMADAAPASAAADDADNLAMPVTVPSAVVWDFDWSLVNENSDTWIFEQLASPATRALMRDTAEQWTQRCDRAALSLQLRDGVPVAAVAAAFSRLPIFPEHLQVVRELHAAGVHQFIVSDANTMFIKAFLDAHDLVSCFSAVVSNTARSQSRVAAEMDAAQLLAHAPAIPADTPARVAAVEDHGTHTTAAAAAPALAGDCDSAAPVLRIAAYHEHACSMGQCPVNMCKGLIVRHELFNRTTSSNGEAQHHEAADRSSLYATRTGWPAGPVAYVGDGTGDLCAAHALRGHDTLLVRRGFRLDKFLLRQRRRAAPASNPAAPGRTGGDSGGSGDGVRADADGINLRETETASAEDEQCEPLLECAVRRWDGGKDLRQLLLAAVGLQPTTNRWP